MSLVLSGKSPNLNNTLSTADEETIKRVEEVAQRKGFSMAKVALSWVAAKTVSPVVGISSEQRIEENVVDGIELTEEEMKYLEEPYVPKVVRGHKSLHQVYRKVIAVLVVVVTGLDVLVEVVESKAPLAGMLVLEVMMREVSALPPFEEEEPEGPPPPPPPPLSDPTPRGISAPSG
ncbi:hypothetical protein E1B28_003579 [Marasmius oreades]|uniref:NADP-dependent oxidoreductase domain-containing protein n=1 Tax=Marasmius oreades TaxID=181124 RepID=A0A9P7UNK0_9AGAR|nr:uncharacterized protein E1B28_003579 [Marasmius oreades]KAG7086059.1 hypothetical protein E1B28_003579 [Marasmius oreades]